MGYLKKIVPGIITLAVMAFSASCWMQPKPPAQEEEPAGSADVKQFLSQGHTPAQIIAFLNDNLDRLEKTDTNVLVAALEEEQERMLRTLEGELSAPAVQEALRGKATGEFAGLVQRAQENGFRLATAEGTYFPVIDYTLYEGWKEKAGADLAQYIDIMAQKTRQPPAADAALTISWEDLLRRAMQMESFVTVYPESPYASKINELYKAHRNVVFFGLDNTPLFERGSNKINQSALEDYRLVVGEKPSSAIGKTLQQFLDALSQTGYVLNQKAEEIRKGL